MVGEVRINEVLDEGRLRVVVERALGPGWAAAQCCTRRAAEGLTGFLGDHFRVRVMATKPDQTATLHLFVKCLPLTNHAKADFISQNGFFKRETLLIRLMDELGGDVGPLRWRPKVYYYDETMLVMPDLAVEGFAPKHFLATLELPEVLATATAVARFHASFTNFVTKKTVDPLHPYNFLDDHAVVMREPVFCDSPFLHTCAKLSANIINMFSDKYKNTIPDLEPKLFELYLEACNSLRNYDNTLNVILHKDLWINNIMFGPEGVVLVDFQCVRFGPPAFDLLILLYLTTTREFRDAHEKEVLFHYYTEFMKSLDDASEDRVKKLGYDKEEFFRWCQVGRMFGLMISIAIFPYVLMDPKNAVRHYDDPTTYEKHCNEDRTGPVLQEARASPRFLGRQLQNTEEFIDKYLLQKSK